MSPARMNPTLYRGVWPRNVSKLAKYSVRHIDGEWRVTVRYEAGAGLTYLAVEGGDVGLPARVNDIKIALQQAPGGAFYVNEYRHVIVPIDADPSSGSGAHYYYACNHSGDFAFEFDGQVLSTRPVRIDGSALASGERWIGPRPGIPYVLSAGGADVYYDTPALEGNPLEVRPMVSRKVRLSEFLDARALARAVEPVQRLRGHSGGRFYVNEYGALFTPVDEDSGGLEYIYCGQVDLMAWFPEPPVP